MPQGIVHRITTIGIASVGGTVLAKAGVLPPAEAVAFASGCAAGVFLTPDLDLVMGCDAQNMARRSFGWPLAAAWRLFWIPYSIVIPHRSFLSHGPVIGTIIRLLYLSIPVGLVSLLVSKFTPINWGFLKSEYMLLAVLGLIAADAAHYIMDKFLPG